MHKSIRLTVLSLFGPHVYWIGQPGGTVGGTCVSVGNIVANFAGLVAILPLPVECIFTKRNL